MLAATAVKAQNSAAQPEEGAAYTWLLCKRCDFPLAPMLVSGAQAVLVFGNVVVYQAVVECPRCHAKRRFVSGAVDRRAN